MKYYKIINNLWQEVEINNIENHRQVELYDYNNNQELVFIGIGIY